MPIIIDYRDDNTEGSNWTADPTDIIHSFQLADSDYRISKIEIFFYGLNPYGISGAACSTYLADANGKPIGDVIETAYDIVSISGPLKKLELWFNYPGEVYVHNTRYCFKLHFDTVNSGPPYENDNGIGEYYYINDVLQTNQLSMYIWGDVLPALPSKPTNPTPAHESTGVDFSNFRLAWQDGGGATSYDVYIGPSGNLVKVSSSQTSAYYVTNLDELETIFGASPINQRIYWRVDAKNDAGTTQGDEWWFDARPAKPTNPNPINGYSGMTLDWTTFSWE